MDIQEGDFVRVNDEFFTSAGPHKNAKWALERTPVYVLKVMTREEGSHYTCGFSIPVSLVIMFGGVPFAPLDPKHVEMIHRCSFRSGDRARLNETPEITPEKSWGWSAYKNTLVKGREGTVQGVSYYKGTARYYWKPDDQTWTSSQDGVEHPVDKPSLFCFGERWLDPVTARVEDAA